MLEIINGDIFDSKEKYLIHQCNCVTIKAAHLAKDVFRHYPYADVYKNRINKDVPGTIKICGNGINQRFIIACFAQLYPGNSKYNTDSYELRQKWFHRCLFEISIIDNLESVAIPYKIGCGAAGGNWINYFNLIERFANYIYQQQNAKVIIYKKD